jgi:hypothetical protein
LGKRSELSPRLNKHTARELVVAPTTSRLARWRSHQYGNSTGDRDPTSPARGLRTPKCQCGGTPTIQNPSYVAPSGHSGNRQSAPAAEEPNGGSFVQVERNNRRRKGAGRTGTTVTLSASLPSHRRAHNGEPCTQTSALSCLSFDEIIIVLLSTGDFTPHCATGANECSTLHAQSQHAR